MDPAQTARRMWPLLEPIHAVVYFADEVRTAAGALKIDRGARYFALRAAPLGAVGAEAVTAVFAGFAPSRVAAALPAVWRTAGPGEVAVARSAGASAALRRLLADVEPAMVLRAAHLAAEAADHVGSTAGRPLAAANLALLAGTTRPLDRLWQALTVLREHRGDGHVVALTAGEIGPVEAHVLRAAAGEADLGFLRTSRGWADEDVEEAIARLRHRGWIDETGSLTSAGRSARSGYEMTTDRLAAAPWRHLGVERADELAALLLPLAERVVAGHAEAMRIGLGSPWPVPAPADESRQRATTARLPSRHR